MTVDNEVMTFIFNHPHFMIVSDEISFVHNHRQITARNYLKKALSPNFSDKKFKQHLEFMSISYNALLQDYQLQK